jgi:hypothetical protein
MNDLLELTVGEMTALRNEAWPGELGRGRERGEEERNGRGMGEK